MPGGRCESGGGQLPFGSRDGLYLAVLENVQQYLVGLQQLINLYESDLAPRQKMENLLTFWQEMPSEKMNGRSACGYGK